MAIRYQFTDFTLDTDERKLSRGERRIKLRPKVYQLLDFLIANRHRVVTKQEVFDDIWGRKFVSDATLNTCLRELRQALGDSGRQQNLVRTLHGQGYQFIAAIESAPGHSDTAPDISEATPLQGEEYKRVCVAAGQLTVIKPGSDQNDPEARYQQSRQIFALIENAIERYGGHVIEWRDNLFMAVFGAPVALEDYSRRAVLALLEIEKNIRRYTPDDESALRLGAGINAGTMLVASREGTMHPVHTSLGGTREFAEQIRDTAHAGQILVAASVQSALSNEFAFDALQREFPGSADVYEVTDVLQFRAGVPQRYMDSQFIGREQEMDILLDRFQRSARGEGQVVLISAEPGMGKSRLVAEVLTRLRHASLVMASGSCLPSEQSKPFSALTYLLRDKAGIAAADSDLVIIEKLEKLLARQRIDDPVSRALLLELFRVVKQSPEIADFSPALRRSKLLDLMDDLIIHPVEPSVTVLVIEDLHWVDASTEHWLTRAVTKVGHQALLILLTCRPGYQAPWSGQNLVSQISLLSLSVTHANQLLRASYRKGELPQDDAKSIVRRAQGNPFFIEEMAAAYQPDDNKIPDSVQAVLSERIDKLAPEQKKILQTAAVLGSSAPLRLLQTLSELNGKDFFSQLQALEYEGLLFERGARSDPAIEFRHALIQDVAYQSLLAQTRQKTHQQIVELLVADYQEYCARHPSLLAQHATAAGDSLRAIDYWLQAGRLAHREHANQEAASHIRAGLGLLDTLPDGDDRDLLELGLLTTLSPVLMAAKGYGAAEVADTCERARVLCQSVGENAPLFSILVGLWNFYWVRGETQTALNLGKQLLDLATVQSNPRYLMRAHIALGEIQFHIGDVITADKHLQQAIELADSLRESEHRVHTSHVAGLCYASWCAWFLGRDAESKQLADEALALARSLSDSLGEAVCLSLLAERCQLDGDPEQCQRLADQAIAVSREQEFPFWEGTASVLSGWAQVMLRAGDDSLKRIEHGLEIFRQTGARTQIATWLGLLAEACLEQNQPARAMSAIDEALQWINDTGERYNESEIYRLKAMALQSCDSADASSIRDAIDRARQIALAQRAEGHLRRIHQMAF